MKTKTYRSVLWTQGKELYQNSLQEEIEKQKQMNVVEKKTTVCTTV